MPSAFAAIETEVRDGVFTITLNRPASLNALSAEMCLELSAAVRMARRDDAIRCVVLKGAGRAFCAGGDVRELASLASVNLAVPSPGLGDFVRDKLNPLIARLRALEKPVIAVLHGAVAGGGLGLALAADLRLGARSATFAIAFPRIGLAPDAGTTLALVQTIGYARAAELCFLAAPLSAETAERIGLVNCVVDDPELPRITQEWSDRIVALPALALALTKRALNRAWGATLDEQLEYEAHLQETLGRTADHREGVDAFLQKRPPRFAGH